MTTKTETETAGETIGKKTQIDRTSLSKALTSMLKACGGRQDINFKDAPEVHAQMTGDVPIEERGGYPLVFHKGSADPAKWKSKEGVDVVVDFNRAPWLPDDWGQGIKTTSPTCRSYGGGGGTLTAYVTPCGKMFYHKKSSEKWAGQIFDAHSGYNGQVRLARLKAQESIQLCRRQIKDLSRSNAKIGTDSDTSFFTLLNASERKHLYNKDDFHFAVVSARRATKIAGIQDILGVQTQLLEAGVTPTWYVDADSLPDYQRLGLKAVVGGNLTPARNQALEDAHRLGKVCVQCSDDITAWEYRHGPQATERTDEACNRAWDEAIRYVISPLVAAQFILAKMRGAPEKNKPHLGGVYMLGSCSRTMTGPPFARTHFIIGDFFVADVCEELKVKFNTDMTLKEDYDFSCAHIREYGSVMRCQRMTLKVKHYSNSGGACSNRDGNGTAERRNIAILKSKWPRAFRPNPKRKNEVIMSWPANGDAEGLLRNDSKPRVPMTGDDPDHREAILPSCQDLTPARGRTAKPGFAERTGETTPSVPENTTVMKRKAKPIASPRTSKIQNVVM